MSTIVYHWRNQLLFSALFIAVFLGFLWIFQSMLLPFVLGFAVAYLLNPMVNGLGKIGMSRTISSLVILGIFCVVVLVFLAVLIPILYKELSALSHDFPVYIEQLKILAAPYIEQARSVIGQQGDLDLSALGQQLSSAFKASQIVIGGLAASGNVISSFLTLLFVMPFVAFFMMVEWPKVMKWGQDLLPRDHEKTILNLLTQMDKKVAGFVRGQISIAAFLAVGYALVLSLLGLKYGFLIGIMAGILNIIPLIGSVAGLVVGVLVAWLQEGALTYVAMVGGVFIAGQLIEGNILTPKLLGDNVGLHPLWIFFALMAGGALFGITGMLISVPVAAVIGVLCGFMIEQYKESSVYKGHKNVSSNISPKAKKTALAKRKSSAKNKKTPAKKIVENKS